MATEHSTDSPPEEAIAGGYAGVESRMVLLDALAALPPRQRAVVVLRYWRTTPSKMRQASSDVRSAR